VLPEQLVQQVPRPRRHAPLRVSQLVHQRPQERLLALWPRAEQRADRPQRALAQVGERVARRLLQRLDKLGVAPLDGVLGGPVDEAALGVAQGQGSGGGVLAGLRLGGGRGRVGAKQQGQRQRGERLLLKHAQLAALGQQRALEQFLQGLDGGPDHRAPAAALGRQRDQAIERAHVGDGRLLLFVDCDFLWFCDVYCCCFLFL